MARKPAKPAIPAPPWAGKRKARKERAARGVVVAAARAAADAMSIAAGEAPIDPEADPDPDARGAGSVLEGAPPPPPPPARDGEPVPGPPPAALTELGPPPADPLAAQAWLHRVMIVSAADAAADAKISARERRKELRTISAAAARLLPHARLFAAEQLIKADRAELEEKRSRRGAKLEARPAAAVLRMVPGAAPATEAAPVEPEAPDRGDPGQ